MGSCYLNDYMQFWKNKFIKWQENKIWFYKSIYTIYKYFFAICLLIKKNSTLLLFTFINK